LFQRDTSNIISFGDKFTSISNTEGRTAFTTTATASETTTTATTTTITSKETGLQPYVKQKFRESRFSKLTRGLRKTAGYVIRIAR